MSKRILVLRGGALGDFLLTLPALQLLRERWPHCQLSLVGNTTAATLGLVEGAIDETFSQHEARWAALYGDSPLPDALKSWLLTFDIVLCFWPDPERELRARFPLHPGQTFIQAEARPLTHPAARHFCEALAPLGIPCPDSFEYRFKALRKDTAKLPSLSIALHPGSSSAARNWPSCKWRELADHLVKKDFRLLVISGEADEEQRAEFASLRCEQAHMLSLTELAGKLAACDFYLGHDTGISHLAAALGLPALILFGPSNPLIWAPQGRYIRVLQAKPSLSEMPLEPVLEALELHPAFPV